MGDGIHQGLLPGQGRVFQALPKEQVVQDHALADVLLDAAHGLVDEGPQGAVDAHPLDHVQGLPKASFGALVLDEVDAATRMPSRRIRGKQKQGGRGDLGPVRGAADEMIRTGQQRAGVGPGVHAFREGLEGGFVQVLPGRGVDVLPFVRV